MNEPAATPVSRAPAAGREARGSLRAAVAPRFAVLYALLFLLGMLWAGWAQPVGSALARLAGYVVDAQYSLLLARGNVVGSGDAEFAILPAGEGARAAIERFVGARAGWGVRDSAVPGWVVVTAPAGRRQTLALLREQPFTRLAMRNRGVWLCH